MKEFKNNEKSQILAMARFLYTNYTIKREKVENQLKTAEDKFDFNGKLEAYRKKLEEQYNERTKSLRAKIEEYKQQEEVMSGPIRTLLLDNHPIEEVVNVGYVSEGDGKRRLTATFKYPDTILPPEDNLGIEGTVDEGPEYDGAGFNGSAEELAADIEQERLADEARADAMHDCEEREADIDVDMQGEFKPIEEGPAMPPMDEVMQEVDELVDEAAALTEAYGDEKPDYYIPEETKEMGDSFVEAMQQVVDSDPVSQEEMEQLEREANEMEAMFDDPSTDDDDSESPWDDDDDASDEDGGEDDDNFDIL